MAAIRLRWCERCGRKVAGGQFTVPMRKGVFALVCTGCYTTIRSIFTKTAPAGLSQLELFPALKERFE